jgi:hypothetical protein
MANINTPRGLSPVGTITGAAYNEQGRLYALANDASNTYAIGDVVKVAGGADVSGVPYVTKWADGDTPVGVIVGIRVADPTTSLEGVTLALNQIYLGLNAGTRYVFVVDDPNVIFQVESDSTGVSAADVFSNATLTVTANQTSLAMSSPLSSSVLDSGSILGLNDAGSLELPLQIIGIEQIVNNAPGAYANVLVKWNYHQFVGAQGTAN